MDLEMSGGDSFTTNWTAAGHCCRSSRLGNTVLLATGRTAEHVVGHSGHLYIVFGSLYQGRVTKVYGSLYYDC